MSAPGLSDYAPIVGRERIDNLRRLARRLEGLKVVVVNSTRVGGGVAEMLNRHVPLFGELGIAIRWEIVEGTPEFFEATKTMHNALQGAPRDLTPALRAAYLETRYGAGMGRVRAASPRPDDAARPQFSDAR